MISLAHVRDGDLVYRAICRHRVEKSLSLELEFSDDEFKLIHERRVESSDEDEDDYVSPGRVEELFIYSQ